MPSDEAVLKFRTLLENAIDIRERVLFPANPLYEISQSIHDQDVTTKEQGMLKCLLTQFDKMFEVE